MEGRNELNTYSTNSEAGAPLHIFIRQQGSRREVASIIMQNFHDAC